MRLRPAQVNWISSRLSVKSGAPVTWFRRRNSATSVTAPIAISSQEGHQALATRAGAGAGRSGSADAIDGVAATGVHLRPHAGEVRLVGADPDQLRRPH